jgi:hypothetical protein
MQMTDAATTGELLGPRIKDTGYSIVADPSDANVELVCSYPHTIVLANPVLASCLFMALEVTPRERGRLIQ